MTSRERFAALSRGLAVGVAATEGLLGLVLLGSASDDAVARRDEWSDHDFFAVVEAGRAAGLRPDLSWLPDPDRIVLTAREGEIGFAALYDDGHVLEFAVAEVDELAGAVAGDATVVVDDADGSVARLVAQARHRADVADRFDPGNDARLVLLKLLIGVGRARRGELLNAGELVRIWAVRHLVRTIRGLDGAASGARDAIDPVRRFEVDFPDWGERIASAVAADVEAAARAILRLMRERLEPGWSDFPSAAADTVQRRLGWSDLEG